MHITTIGYAKSGILLLLQLLLLLYYATHRTSDFLQKERFVASLHDMRLGLDNDFQVYQSLREPRNVESGHRGQHILN